MPLLRGKKVLELSGTLDTHSKCFQEAANREKCVISSRSVGPLVTGLLRESYATKGFHNKAKSCTWGPMAGFVLNDPRFTKAYGGGKPPGALSTDDRDEAFKMLKGQRDAILKAFKAGASTVPVYISEQRRRELLEKNAMRAGWRLGVNSHYYYANPKHGDRLFLFLLRRTDQVPGGTGPMWQVFYALTERAMPADMKDPAVAEGLGYLPVKAMVDPDCPQQVKGTFRAATTGDYDLFAVFPLSSDYDPRGKDRRLVPGSDKYRVGVGEFIRHEDKDLGNITKRVKSIMVLVNQLARRKGYIGGDIVHHGDEGGRPKVTEMEKGVIAWVPGELEPYYLRDVADFKAFVTKLRLKYQVMMNPGWFRELGISISKGGAYTVD
jgi:hypothetical protein